ncbi:TPR-like protein, partial [Amniculicola lignicola CBS 123094]
MYPTLRRTRYQLNNVVQEADTSQSLFDLAGKHKEDEKWTDAENAYLQVITIREKEHGIDDQLLRDSYYNLGVVYHNLQRFDEAADRLELALDGEDKAYGAGDNRSMFTAYKLGQVYKEQKKTDAATRMFLRAVGRETSFGAGDIAVRNSRFELGLIYENLGQLEDAVNVYELTVKGEEEAVGIDHADTLITVNRLANMYRRLERFNDAERSYTRILDARQKTLGPNHKRVLDTYYNLGLVYKDSKNYVAAGINFSKAMTGCETTLGANDPETLDAMDEAAGVLVLDSKYKGAADLYRTILQRRRESLGSDHADTKESEHKL